MISSPGTSPTPSTSQPTDPAVIAKFKRQMRWLWIHYVVGIGLGVLVYGPPRILPEAYMDGFFWAVIVSSTVCTVLFYKCPACSRSLVGTTAPKACPRCGTALVDVKR